MSSVPHSPPPAPPVPPPRERVSDTSTGSVSTFIHGLADAFHYSPRPSIETILHVQHEAPPPTRSHSPTRPTPILDRFVSFANGVVKDLFRHKTIRTVELTRYGNFVVEIPVPERVKARIGFSLGEGREFTHLRYSAVTGDPDEFLERGFSLRASDLCRHTEIFIVITMYNEDERLFIKTWKAVVKNITHMCGKKGSRFHGPDGWKQIVVCIVADGRQKKYQINKKTLTVIGLMGAYQDGVVKTSVNSELVTAHLFEYSTTLTVDPDGHYRDGLVPVQVIFCMKEKNAKKINSHRWFFNAFGKVLQPTVCVLLDVGTKPTDKSIYKLWKAFDRNPRVAGACGEIYVEQGLGCSKLLNPLVAAQNFEYKVSNILDKPLESCFGFISVLPGAFSAYRYRALQNGPDGKGPLEKYFIGEAQHGGHNISKANMYLAEDRILCFELVSKRGEAWVLKYVRKAKAETDVPDTMAEFISQRRRWLNGSFFAGVHSLINFHQILFRSAHPFHSKMLFMLQTFYNLITLLFNWFALGNFYVIFYLLCQRATDYASPTNPDPFSGYGSLVFIALREVYLMAIVLVFLASLGNRPQTSRTLYFMCFLLFSLMMGTLLYVVGFQLYHVIPVATKAFKHFDFTGPGASTIVVLIVSLMSTYGVWGTKGDTKAHADIAPVHTKSHDTGPATVTTDLPENQMDIDAVYERSLSDLLEKPMVPDKNPDPAQAQEDFFRLFRTRVVVFWMASNALLVLVMTTPNITAAIGIDEGTEGLQN
ncbi:Chitin synthase, class 2 [Irineochytrium annulatum]|nr:Chitin synthase, class 2 [Irineochytrium annulatum]